MKSLFCAIHALYVSSLPSRERGLKSRQYADVDLIVTSLPSRERGLKFVNPEASLMPITVAPLAGAWIEMGTKDAKKNVGLRRSPRGSVD